MEDAGLVRGGQRIGDLHAVAQRLGHAEAPGGNHPVQRAPGDVLHHDEVDAGVRPDVVDGDDARVVQRAGRARFLDEALPAVRIGDLVGGQDLDGDDAIEMGVAGFVDDAHAAFAQLGFDRVAVESLADHQDRCLPRVS